MYCEDDLLPLSALQHYMVCPRQCALIHLEQQWVENTLTAQGKVMHERVHQNDRELRSGVLTTRSLAIRSLSLGLVGKADVVEFHQDESGGPGRPFPVEYKRGSPKAEPWDKVQLCAQGLCLEEMLSVAVPAGALFYGETRRRLDVPFDSQLRELTVDTARAVHEMIASGVTPPAEVRTLCRNCSLKGICLPEALAKSAGSYIRRSMSDR